MTAPSTPPPSLVGGPYAAPACQPGDLLRDKARGRVPVAGITDAPIPWPYTHRTAAGEVNSKRALILTGDLARAVKFESVQAIVYHWGVSRWTVRDWRRALGVGRMAAEGTRRLWTRPRIERCGKPSEHKC